MCNILIFIVSIFALFSKLNAKTGFGPGEQEWGYAKVRHNVNFFWWLFYANPIEKPVEFDPYQKPLLIWLDNFSTSNINFRQYGPMDIRLHTRNFSLVNDYNVLFIDSVLGNGFSYVEKDFLYPKKTSEIAYNILACIREINKKFPKLMDLPIYIIAQQFSGKVAVEVANVWLSGRKKNVGNNLKGLILANPTVSPADVVRTWGEYLKKKEIVNENGAEAIFEAVKEVRTHVRLKHWREAFDAASELLNTLLFAIPDGKQLDEFVELLFEYYPTLSDHELDDLMNDMVKKVLQLNSTWGVTNSEIFYENSKNEIMRPIIYKFKRLLSKRNIQIVLLNTQLDLNVSLINTLNWFKKLTWRESHRWSHLPKMPIVVDDTNVGYYREFENVHEYTFINTTDLNYEDKAKILNEIILTLQCLNYNT